MNGNVIKCGTVEDLIAVCAGLEREGIAFNANTSAMTVVLTGY